MYPRIAVTQNVERDSSEYYSKFTTPTSRNSVPKRKFSDTNLIIAIGFLVLILISGIFVFDIRERHTNEVHASFAKLQKLSFLANEATRQSNRIDCWLEARDKHKTDGTDGDIAETGGWCKSSMRLHRTDKQLREKLSSFFLKEGAASVGSFGEGLGEYQTSLRANGINYQGYDGAPSVEELTHGHVRHADFTGIHFMPAFDWIISLEVGEHLPPSKTDTFLRNIGRHATKGVILTWAVPGQTGKGHINGLAHGEVKKLMEAQGFDIDPYHTEMLKTAATLSWLKNNLMVFRRVEQREKLVCLDVKFTAV